MFVTTEQSEHGVPLSESTYRQVLSDGGPLWWVSTSDLSWCLIIVWCVWTRFVEFDELHCLPSWVASVLGGEIYSFCFNQTSPPVCTVFRVDLLYMHIFVWEDLADGWESGRCTFGVRGEDPRQRVYYMNRHVLYTQTCTVHTDTGVSLSQDMCWANSSVRRWWGVVGG